MDGGAWQATVHRVTKSQARLSHFIFFLGFPCGSTGKESACKAGDLDLIPGLGRSLEKGMAAHSSIIAWGIPWTEESGGLRSTG